MAARKETGGKLAAYVHVSGQVLAPGDVPDAEVATRITNPKAWEGGELPSEVAKAADQTAG